MTRETLRAVHEELLGLAGRQDDGRALEALAAARSRLAAVTFRLVVLGEYKRGKSTLANALLGSPVLPVDVLPLTSVITEVVHGPAKTARVELVDGRSEPISLDELPGWVTEAGNPRNRKGVRRAWVELPSPLLRQGVTIVDTPGVGSVFEHNTEVTLDFLAESDAVVIVLAADQPLSAEERRLLAALSDITDHVLFAVNRIDLLSGPDAAKSLDFIRRTLADLDGAPPDHVFPISAREALDAETAGESTPAPFAAFARALERVLVGRKADILEARARALLLLAADFLALGLDAERRGLEQERQVLGEVRTRLEDTAAKAAGELDRSVVLLQHDLRRLHEMALRRELDATQRRLADNLWPRVLAALDGDGTRPLHATVDELSRSIGEWVVEDLRRWHPTTRTLVEGGLGRALEEHMARVDDAVGGVIADANERLGTSARVPRAVAPLDEHARFYFKDWDYAGGSLRMSSLWFRLPRRWAEPRARRALRELLDRRIRQNLEGIRYDWVSRLEDAGRRFSKSAGEQLEGVVRLLVDGIGRAERLLVDGGAGPRREDLEAGLVRLTAIRERLAPTADTTGVPAPREAP